MLLPTSEPPSGDRERTEKDAHSLRASATLQVWPDAQVEPAAKVYVLGAMPPGLLHTGGERLALLKHVTELVHAPIGLQSSAVLREDRERWLPPC